MADYRSAYFGLTGKYPTDVQEDEAEDYSQRLASSPYQRLGALAGWVSGANIAAGAPGPRFGSLHIVKPSGGLAEQSTPTISAAVRGLGREYIQYMRNLIRQGSATPTRYSVGKDYPTGQYFREARMGGPPAESVVQGAGAAPSGMTSKQVLQHELTHGKYENLPARVRAFAEKEMEEIAPAHGPAVARANRRTPAEGVGANLRGYAGQLTPSEAFAMTGEGSSPYSQLSPLAQPYQEAGEHIHRVVRGYLRSLMRQTPEVIGP